MTPGNSHGSFKAAESVNMSLATLAQLAVTASATWAWPTCAGSQSEIGSINTTHQAEIAAVAVWRVSIDTRSLQPASYMVFSCRPGAEDSGLFMQRALARQSRPRLMVRQQPLNHQCLP